MSDPTMAAARPTKRNIPRKKERKSRKGTFGIPPPAKFDFDALPDSAWLTSDEVAAVLRKSKATVPIWRGDKNHPLRWERIDGKPLYRVRAVREFIASRTERAKIR